MPPGVQPPAELHNVSAWRLVAQSSPLWLGVMVISLEEELSEWRAFTLVDKVEVILWRNRC